MALTVIPKPTRRSGRKPRARVLIPLGYLPMLFTHGEKETISEVDQWNEGRFPLGGIFRAELNFSLSCDFLGGTN